MDYEKQPEAGWRQARGTAPLSDVFASVPVAANASKLRKLFAFFGPGYLVAVGYMDPGNWATSIAGGSKYGYALLSVVVVSSIMAMVLQALCARLAIATGRDLAQACRDAYPRPVALGLWVLAELAICATDLAEVIGTAIGLNLLFGIPLAWGVAVTALDVFLILYLQRLGFRYLEAFIITLLGIIAVCFGAQIIMASPQWGEVAAGLVPRTEIVSDPGMLYLALGILGATVMPHNLYLHSAIVHTRTIGQSAPEKRRALGYITIDSCLALTLAFFVNAAILVLAAATFHTRGHHDVAELGDAHAMLLPLLGSVWAPSLFGIALLCCGLNSTVTATLAGQSVMEGFLRFRMKPWMRRLITRFIAIIPAAAVTVFYGEAYAGQLLIMSQVVLSLQLPFAVVPLVWMTTDRTKMGELVSPLWLSAVAVFLAILIIGLNMKLLFDILAG